MESVAGVYAVHDVHLWTITTGMDAMSGHVVVEDMNRSADILSTLNELLSERFGIAHTTIKLEQHRHQCRMSAAGPGH
jgi:cobalt-zinc-cadmium efflux system protein